LYDISYSYLNNNNKDNLLINKIIASIKLIETQSYQNNTLGIELKYPSNFNITNNRLKTFTIQEKGDFSPPIIFTITSSFGLTKNEPLEETLQLEMNRIKQTLNSTSIKYHENKFNATEGKAFVIEYSYSWQESFISENTKNMKGFTILTCYNDLLYSISFAIEEKRFKENKAILDGIINSIKFKKSQTYVNSNLGVILEHAEDWIQDKNKDVFMIYKNEVYPVMPFYEIKPTFMLLYNNKTINSINDTIQYILKQIKPEIKYSIYELPSNNEDFKTIDSHLVIGEYEKYSIKSKEKPDFNLLL